MSTDNQKEEGTLEIQQKALAEYAQGIPTARGGKWYASRVKYALDNPIYRGKLIYNGEKIKRAELALL